MINIRMFNCAEDNREKNRCDCGRNSCAILETDNVKIGFCEDCLKDIIEQFQDVQNKIKKTCQYCKHFQKDKYDYKVYGGKCLAKWFTSTDKFGKELKLNPDTNHLDTCENFEEMTND